MKELRPDEQRAIRQLKSCLDVWSQGCIVCDFKGNPIRPRDRHATHDCHDYLYRTVQTWAPLFLTRLQRLADADTQSCPVCLVPRLICGRWKQGKSNEWAATGSKCQYDGVVVFTIVTALEEAVEVREELDLWMDSWLHSRNLDRVCQWLSERTVGNDLCAMRAIEVFQLVSGAWGRLNRNNQGYHCPRSSWITSTGLASDVENKADEAAYALRKQRRQSLMAQNQREGRDEAEFDSRLLAWLGKCPICYTLKKMGTADIDTYHDLEACQDEKRDLVLMEVARLHKIEFASDLCCKVCAVPIETCNEHRAYRMGDKTQCLYKGALQAAVAAITIAGPDVVVQKMYKWMQSKGVWIGNTALGEEDVQQVTIMMLEWFSQKASWRYITASVLVQVFTQLDQWVEAFGKGEELEDWVNSA